MSTLFFHFKKVLYRYRDMTQVELSNDLIRWNFLQLCRGNKTALIEKVELKLGHPIYSLLHLAKDDRPREYQHRTMYTTQFMLDNGLEPQFNRVNRSITASYATKKNKKLFIANCSRHGVSLFQVREKSNSCVACASKGQADNILEGVQEYLKIIKQDHLEIRI